MTREDIVRMAKEAGMESFNICVELDDFAALVASAEREACAEICKKHADVYAGLEENREKREGDSGSKEDDSGCNGSFRKDTTNR